MINLPQKTGFKNKTMKPFLLTLLIAICFAQFAAAQTIATKSYPFSVGTISCGSGTQQIQFYNYSATTNTIQNATGGLVNPCIPQLRTGLPVNGTQRFTSNLASVSFNPKDHKTYYLWTTYAPSTKTYAWSWPVGTCPGTAANKLDTIRSFAADIAGVAFDNNGNGYLLEYTTVPVAGVYKAMIRSINFATGVMGAADTLALTGGAKIYATGSGDVAMTPSGQMYFVVDNKLFTPNYLAYTGTASLLTCTYIDTVKLTGNFVGLTYADGKNIAAYSGGGCPYYQVDPITALTSLTTKNNVPSNVNSTADFATIVSGVGAAKKVISVTPTGTANQYDVVYDIVVKNYGNMDITNLQVLDTLANINGAVNVTLNSVTIPVNPNGYTVNALYTGKGPLAINYSLLNGTPTLPNYPVVNGTFTIRISCRLSNIISGVIYYNQATVGATDYNGNALKDFSLNGNNNSNNPDANGNDKPDDVGEDTKTPFLISVTPSGSPCVTLTKVLYTQDFGTVSGTGLSTSLPAPVLGSGASAGTGITSYASNTTPPIPVETYAITNNANNANTTRFVNLTDHTLNANGAMLVVNADAAFTKLYRGSFNYPVCPSQQYSISFYAAFLGNATYQTVCNGSGGFKYPKIQVNVIDGGSLTTIATLTTADIVGTGWQQFGLKFISPGTYTSIIFELLNAGPGGCGNDLAIDDIQFGSCDPIPVVNASALSGCLGGSATFTGSLTDPTAIPGAKEYQWQVATALAGPYVDIVGATSSTYTINPVNPSDTGKYYRLAVAAFGNMITVGCRFNSPGIKLTGGIPSTGPSSISSPPTTICNGSSITLTAVGATLSPGANYQWGTGAVVGTGPIGGATSSTLTVSPGSTTTYWVRVENTAAPCAATTGGVTVTVTVNQPSAAPTSVTGLDICNPGSTTLTAVGATLGTSANYQWGTGSTVGASPIVGATGSTLVVSPGSTTTYWVRVENTAGPCTANTSGLTKTITVSQPSAAPTSVTGLDICNPGSSTLTAVGGVLGTNANYQCMINRINNFICSPLNQDRGEAFIFH